MSHWVAQRAQNNRHKFPGLRRVLPIFLRLLLTLYVQGIGNAGVLHTV